MDNLQLKSDPIPAVPAVPGATPAWMTLVTSLIASGAQIASAVAQANAHTGTNVQLPPNYTLNVPPAAPVYAPANTGANNTTAPTKSFMDNISTNTVIIVVAIVLAICGGAFFYFKSKKIA